METMLKTGAPGDYTSISLAMFRHIRESTFGTIQGTTSVPHRFLGCTPAEFPGDEDERMLFMHQYPSAVLEDEAEDDVDEDLIDDDLDEDLDDEDFEEIPDDEDLDVDLVDEEEDEEDGII